ncbi:aminoglycoside phosphotransferase family protein [Magnetovibrio sp.]|uniref:aminoglycoside phosphotransferase family protein n=1 Tax=Magnetovibrio sp. TaxID=2024836 RepID=UPI002F94028D
MTEGTRTQLLTAFLRSAGWQDAERHPLAADASFRRYIRLFDNGKTALVMDAPPSHEDVRPFVLVDKHLRILDFSAPEILAEDETNGFLLLEDFGDATFTKLLARGADERALYTLATDTLIALHALDMSSTTPDWLPPYDDARLRDEAALLLDWFMPAQGLGVSTATRADFERIWFGLFAHVHDGPRTLVLRDYHVDNLMRLDGRDSIKACGLLDFQDALGGHPAYDLMSLLQDARRDISARLQADMLERYRDALNLSGPAWDDFARAYAILAAQRHAKVIGIFTRLDRRDAKPVYLKHIARVWRLLEQALEHPALGDLKAWMDEHIPIDKRQAPEPIA